MAAPPVVGLTWLALMTVVVVGRLDVYLRVDAATGDTTGLRPHVPFTVAATFWWVALALAGLWVMVHGPAAQLLDLAVLAVVVVAATNLHRQSAEPYVLAGEDHRPVCSTTQPMLCVNRDYAPRLAAHARALAALARSLGSIDPSSLPSRFDQAGPRVAGSRPVSGVGAVSLTPSGPVDASNLALDLVRTASNCSAAPTTDDSALLTLQIRLADWVATSSGFPDDLYVETARVTTAEEARSALDSIRAAC
ncbi:MAG: hypothetical protein ACJ71T_08315 [Actinomycetales bacterium]